MPVLTLSLCALLFAGAAAAAEPAADLEATTAKGEKVLLHPNGRWEFVDTQKQAEAKKVAEQFPEKLRELRALFDEVGYANNVFPLNEPGAMFSLGAMPPSNLGALTAMTYTPAHIRMPERSVVNLKIGRAHV